VLLRGAGRGLAVRGAPVRAQPFERPAQLVAALVAAGGAGQGVRQLARVGRDRGVGGLGGLLRADRPQQRERELAVVEDERPEPARLLGHEQQVDAVADPARRPRARALELDDLPRRADAVYGGAELRARVALDDRGEPLLRDAHGAGHRQPPICVESVCVYTNAATPRFSATPETEAASWAIAADRSALPAPTAAAAPGWPQAPAAVAPAAWIRPAAASMSAAIAPWTPLAPVSAAGFTEM
jgi:hypothetical protein